MLHMVPVDLAKKRYVKIIVVDPDSDTHGSAFIWLSWIRIRIGNVDPDPGA